MGAIRLTMKGVTKIYANAMKAHEDEVPKAMEQSVNKMAGLYINVAKKNTPVGKHLARYDKKLKKIFRSNSEHMKRSWGLDGPLKKTALSYTRKVGNSASYASYVNDGHIQHPGQYVPLLGKSLKKRWVEGLNMREKAEKAVRDGREKIVRHYLIQAERGLLK